MPVHASSFWLAHHPPESLHRCFRVGSLFICARCLGTYPAAGLALTVQLFRGDFGSTLNDAFWVMGLALPAVLDWARGQFRPHSGSNRTRLLTGLLLGLAIGRAVFLHMLEPFGLPMVGLLCEAAAAVLVIIALRLRKGAQ